MGSCVGILFRIMAEKLSCPVCSSFSIEPIMRDVEFTARVRQPVLALLVTSRNVIPNRDQRKFGLGKGQPSTVREHQRFVFDSLGKRDVWYVCPNSGATVHRDRISLDVDLPENTTLRPYASRHVSMTCGRRICEESSFVHSALSNAHTGQGLGEPHPRHNQPQRLHTRFHQLVRCWDAIRLLRRWVDLTANLGIERRSHWNNRFA